MKLIPGSRPQDLKNKGLARNTHVPEVNTMNLKLEPNKQGGSPMTFVPRMLFQEKSMEVFQGPQLQGVKPKELTSLPQTQDRNCDHPMFETAKCETCNCSQYKIKTCKYETHR